MTKLKRKEQPKVSVENKDALLDISGLLDSLNKNREYFRVYVDSSIVESNLSHLLKQASDKIEELADELIDRDMKSALRISELEEKVKSLDTIIGAQDDIIESLTLRLNNRNGE